MFLVYPQSCATITISNFRTFSLLARDILYPLAVMPLFPQPQTTTYILPISIDLPVFVISYQWDPEMFSMYIILCLASLANFFQSSPML